MSPDHDRPNGHGVSLEAGSEPAPSELNEILDTFERDWEASASYLQRVASEARLLDFPGALGELVRADVDRRYAADRQVDLKAYFEAFPQLAGDFEAACGVAYEDFRARHSRGLSVESSRWSWVPGVERQNWFLELRRRDPRADDQGPGIAAGAGVGMATDTPVRPAELADVEAASRGAEHEPIVGRMFGDFHLLCLLGTGSFSQVFLARQTSLASRYVALKVVRRTLAEPYHLARMQHTGVVPLYSFHQVGEYSLLCMPYAGATTLADLIPKSPDSAQRPKLDGPSLIETIQASQDKVTVHLRGSAGAALAGDPIGQAAAEPFGGESVARGGEMGRTPPRGDSAASPPLHNLRTLDASSLTLWFAHRVASALAHAHARGIVHGDLKPANILVCNDGEPALIDFNLAVAADCVDHELVGGTLPYMAPEQLRSLLERRPLVSPSSDVYSFGVVLYELIVGRLPFPAPRSAAESDLAAAWQQRSEPSAMPRRCAATAGLQSIVRTCLNRDASRRYVDAAQLLEDLEREVRHLPLRHAREPFWRGRVAKLARRYPRWCSAGPLALVSILLLVAALATGHAWRRQSQVLAARQAAARLNGFIHEQVAELLSATPEEAWLVADRVADDLRGLGVTRAGLPDPQSFAALSPEEQAELAGLLFDHHLATAVLLTESWSQLDASQADAVRAALDGCRQFTDLAERSRVLRLLADRIEDPADARPANRTSFDLLAGEPGRPVEILLEARLLVASGNASRALGRLNALGQVPRHELLFWLTTGEAQLQLGQAEAARLSFTLALNRAPQGTVCYASRARASVALQDYQAAVDDFSRALELAPGRVALVADRALAREKLGDLEAAISDLDQALLRDPASNRLLLIRSRLHQQMGNIGSARDDLRKALNREPRTVEDWVSRGLAQVRSAPARALDDLQRAADLQPGSPLVLQNIAYLQSEHLGDDRAALEALDALLARQPHHESARSGRCVLRARLGDVEGALGDIGELTRRFAKPLPASVYQTACAHALLSPTRPESRAEAVRYLSRALQLGYGHALLDSDPDLEPIRDDLKFQQLKAVWDAWRQ